jgi:homopolymeric O-antigen transport system ATP-binding protein
LRRLLAGALHYFSSAASVAEFPIGCNEHGVGALASITLKNVTTDFPVYGLQRSLRKELFGRLIGGKTHEDAKRRLVVRALDSISLMLRDGDRLGLVGHNGAGKTTLLRVLAGIYPPTQGTARIQGRVSTLFNTAPGLDMDDTGYENIYTCGRLLGMSKEELVRKLPDIEEFCELGDYLSLPVRTYSTGMMMRVGFAVATAIDPEILVLDEGLGAGDARFAERAKLRVDALIKRSNILVIASHSDSMIKEMCNRTILLHHGHLVADGHPDDVIAKYHELLKQPQPPTLTVADALDPVT